MTQRERMAAGLLYDAGDPELVAARRTAGTLCHTINSLPFEAVEERMALLAQLFGALGEGSHIEQPFRCDYGFHITAGKQFYVNYNCVMLDCAPITFGDHVFIAPNCAFYTAGHPLDPAERASGVDRWEHRGQPGCQHWGQHSHRVGLGGHPGHSLRRSGGGQSLPGGPAHYPRRPDAPGAGLSPPIFSPSVYKWPAAK